MEGVGQATQLNIPVSLKAVTVIALCVIKKHANATLFITNA